MDDRRSVSFRWRLALHAGILASGLASGARAECTLSAILKYASSDEQAIEMYNALCKGTGETEANVRSTSRINEKPASSKKAATVAWGDQLAARDDGNPPRVPPGSSASSIVGNTDSKTTAAPSTMDQPAFFKGWGVGLAMIRNKDTLVSDAAIVNGTVRANYETRGQPQLLVAKHFYFHHEVDEKSGTGSCLWTQLGICPGVFIGVGFGGSAGSQIIDMIGGGMIIGFGNPVYDSSKDQAHNVGLGFGRRFNVKTLGDGIAANKPLPAGESQIRYKNTDVTSPFLFYTYKFN